LNALVLHAQSVIPLSLNGLMKIDPRIIQDETVGVSETAAADTNMKQLRFNHIFSQSELWMANIYKVQHIIMKRNDTIIFSFYHTMHDNTILIYHLI
jgi:hypothetical protein